MNFKLATVLFAVLALAFWALFGYAYNAIGAIAAIQPSFGCTVGPCGELATLTPLLDMGLGLALIFSILASWAFYRWTKRQPTH